MGRDEEDRSPLGKNLVTEQMLIRDRGEKKVLKGFAGLERCLVNCVDVETIFLVEAQIFLMKSLTLHCSVFERAAKPVSAKVTGRKRSKPSQL